MAYQLQKRSKAILALVLTVSLVSLTRATMPSNAPYQAHGFNEVPYFHQLLMKNTKWFKLDFIFNTGESCLKNSSWKASLNECEPYKDLQVCCIAMRGDTSGAPWLNAPFNTSYDFSDYLASSAAARTLGIASNPDPVYVWINFNSSIDGVPAMVTTALYEIGQAIQNNKLNLKLSPDFGAYLDNLAEKCQTKGACNAKEQFVNSFDWLDDGTMVNISIVEEAGSCENGFPDSSLAYRIFEPSDADAILNTVDTYLSPDCKKPSSHSNVNDLRLTSNLEPENVQVYLAEYNDDPFLKNANKMVQPESSRAFGRVHQEANVFVSVGAEDGKNMLYLYTLSGEKIFTSTLVQNMENTTPVSGISLSGDYLLVSYEKSSQSDIYQLVEGSSLKLVKTITLPSDSILSQEVVSSSGVLFLGTIAMAENDTLTIAVSSLDLTSGALTEVVSYNATLDLGLVAENLQGTSLSLIADLETTDLFHGVITLSQENEYDLPALYYVFIEVSLTAKSIEVQKPTKNSDFGTSAETHLLYDSASKELMLFDIHTDGLCQCGQAMNNSDQDECAIGVSMATGYNVLASVRGKVNYNWGRYADFKTSVASGDILNGCHPQILHAKLTTGSFPSGGVYRTSEGAAKAVFMNGSIENFEFLDSVVCGRAANFNTPGVFVNSFDLLNPDQFERVESF